MLNGGVELTVNIEVLGYHHRGDLLGVAVPLVRLDLFEAGEGVALSGSVNGHIPISAFLMLNGLPELAVNIEVLGYHCRGLFALNRGNVDLTVGVGKEGGIGGVGVVVNEPLGVVRIRAVAGSLGAAADVDHVLELSDSEVNGQIVAVGILQNVVGGGGNIQNVSETMESTAHLNAAVSTGHKVVTAADVDVALNATGLTAVTANILDVDNGSELVGPSLFIIPAVVDLSDDTGRPGRGLGSDADELFGVVDHPLCSEQTGILGKVDGEELLGRSGGDAGTAVSGSGNVGEVNVRQREINGIVIRVDFARTFCKRNSGHEGQSHYESNQQRKCSFHWVFLLLKNILKCAFLRNLSETTARPMAADDGELQRLGTYWAQKVH